MTITLNLSAELEHRLSQEAAKQGTTIPELSLKLLQEGLSKDRRAEAIALLKKWVNEGDADEQRETGEYLIRVLDEDRLSDRKLFPPELKGISW